MLREGFIHNDIKGNNVCVSVESNDLAVTVSNLGLAHPVGTRMKFGDTNTSDLRRYPWLTLKLLLHDQPCCEATDMNGLAHLIQVVMLLKQGRDHSPS